MNTDGLFSGTNNPNTGTPDSGADVPPMITADGFGNEHDDSASGADVPPMITADGFGNEHDDSASGDESTNGEDGTGDNYFMHIGDNYDDEEGNELSSPPDEDDPMRHLFGGDTLNEDQGNNT